MKIKYISFIFLLFGCFTNRQKEIPLPPSMSETDNLNKDFTKFSLSKRLNTYPFRESAQVKIVSFNLDYNFGPPDLSPGSTEELKKEINISELMENKDFSKMNQVKDLNTDQIAKTSDILFNTCARYSISIYSKGGCYEPRNAILFLDNSNNIYEYFEICFTCNRIETKKKNSSLEEYLCNFMYNDLEKYFNQLGIETRSPK